MSKTLITGDGLDLTFFEGDIQFDIDHPEFYKRLYKKTENDYLDTHLYVFLDTFNSELKTNLTNDLMKINEV